MSSLTAISPLDGRYHDRVKALDRYVSEQALMRYRLHIEVEYLIALSHEPGVSELPPFTTEEQSLLRSIASSLSQEDAARVKEIERTTNHDVKSIEYFLKGRISGTSLDTHREFIHFALTSADINNLAYALMWQDALSHVCLPQIDDLIGMIHEFATTHASVPMLALTHGQSATPTTVGKEYAVFTTRLERARTHLSAIRLLGKCGGATGTWSAHLIAYPSVDWLTFTDRFVTSLGLEPNLLTTQVGSNDRLVESMQTFAQINTILLDLARDTWLYISRGIFGQEKKTREVGSSTMPHKINPIQFENAEGNIGIANALFRHFAEVLPVSRMQRDLSNSTVMRNIGVPLAHSVIAYRSVIEGIRRLRVREDVLARELDAHPEVLTEAIQTVLRKAGYHDPYETLKELTRGETMTLESIRAFITSLDIPKEDQERLLTLTPADYTGLAAQLALTPTLSSPEACS